MPPSIRLRRVSRRAWKLGLEYNYISRRKVALLPIFPRYFQNITIYIAKRRNVFWKFLSWSFLETSISFISCSKWICTASTQLLNSGARAKLLFNETSKLLDGRISILQRISYASYRSTLPCLSFANYSLLLPCARVWTLHLWLDNYIGFG